MRASTPTKFLISEMFRLPYAKYSTGANKDAPQKPKHKPAKRLCFGKDEQRNGRALPLAAGRGIWSLRGRCPKGVRSTENATEIRTTERLVFPRVSAISRPAPLFCILFSGKTEMGPNSKPAQRLLFGEDEQRNGRDLPLAAGRGIWSLRGRMPAERQLRSHRKNGTSGESGESLLRPPVAVSSAPPARLCALRAQKSAHPLSG